MPRIDALELGDVLELFLGRARFGILIQLVRSVLTDRRQLAERGHIDEAAAGRTLERGPGLIVLSLEHLRAIAGEANHGARSATARTDRPRISLYGRLTGNWDASAPDKWKVHGVQVYGDTEDSPRDST